MGPARSRARLDAPLRGIVLGDSFMQGMFIGDDDTPPECLRRDLEGQPEDQGLDPEHGHLGYSPEQYYYSLVEFADRFRPHFVVVSVFGNDFGEAERGRGTGKGDWDEGKYWLDKIIQHCVGAWLDVSVRAGPVRARCAGQQKGRALPRQ